VKGALCSNTSFSARPNAVPCGLAVGASAPPLVNPSGFPQHEVFENEISVATGKHRSARSTRHIAVNRFGSAFAFNDFVECLAVRACEGVTRHTTSPYTALSRPTHRIRTLLHARNVTRLSQPPTRLLKESPQSVGKLAGPIRRGLFLLSWQPKARIAHRFAKSSRVRTAESTIVGRATRCVVYFGPCCASLTNYLFRIS
jgi:hypothetical protein